MLVSPKVSMLRLQPTQSCNLNCSYCYIPASIRRQSTTMSAEVLEATLTRLLEEELLEDRLTISWHGAEPLTAGIGWYEQAFDSAAKILGKDVKISHVFQSNGVLLNDMWCNFLIRHHAHIGVSIDGSEKQNASRVNWAGRPAYDWARKGIECLNRHRIPWTLLSVVTLETMLDPESFVRFVKSTGCATLGFKVEETNNDHRSALENRGDVERLYAQFVHAVWKAFPPDGSLRVREFEEYVSARNPHVKSQAVPVTLIPLRNLTVAANGDYTIFSGELLFRDDTRFVFGNVLDGPLLDSLTTDKFRSTTSEMFSGVRRCAESCPFYSDCGSFYISQKFAEFGSFDAAETLACRLEVKTLFETLDHLRLSSATLS